jgi:hypothetical protein
MGMAWQGPGATRRDEAGEAWKGLARRGVAWPGKAGMDGRGAAGRDADRHVEAGMAWQG